MDGFAIDRNRSAPSCERRTPERIHETPPHLVEDATRQLRSSGYSALRDLRCDAPDGILQLSGRVTCHYLKQVAQEIVASLPGVHRIDNRIEVVSRH